MKHVVMFSGGIGSWAAAKRVAQKHGTSNLTLLFTDTLIEDEDLYRFLEEAAEDVGGTLVKIAEGRTPWQVFNDRRFIGNSRIDPCSETLKRKLSERWLRENCDPADTAIYVGIDWTEEHRYKRIRARWAAKGWRYEAPLCEAPYVSKTDLYADLAAAGIKRPRLYDLGFSHNNCGGFCVKAGQGHFANLLRTMPKRYAEHEAQEEAFRKRLGKDVSILVEVRGGVKRRLTLRQLRERIEGAGQVDMYDIGGCGCFAA